VDTEPLVPDGEVGMVAAPGAAGVGEHQDALLVVHEGLRFGKVCRSCAGLDRETVEAVSRLADDAAGSACDLRHRVGAEPLDNLVEGALNRWQRSQALDHAVAPVDSLTALDRLTIAVGRPG
jgi:hypothetical protein